MTSLYVLDTDHITLVQHNHPLLIRRLAEIPPENIAVTIVPALEQIKRLHFIC
jgi:tRNA(fMet)-specific endonuclease VapC